MPDRLRQDFSLQNPNREALNQRFAVAAMGMKIYSYIETRDTKLNVLSANESEGDQITFVNFQVVDIRSAKLSSVAVPVEEEVVQLDTNHVGTPKFTGALTLRGLFVDELHKFIWRFNKVQWTEFDNLTEDILENIRVNIHQFYQTGAAGEAAAITILRGVPSLKDFLQWGPSECMRRRITSENPTNVEMKPEAPQKNGAPAIEVQTSSNPGSPAQKSSQRTELAIQEEPSAIRSVRRVLDNLHPDASRRTSLPLVHLTNAKDENPDNPHTRQWSLASELEDLDLTKAGRLKPSAVMAKSVRFKKHPARRQDGLEMQERNLKDTDQIRRPQKAPKYPLPKAESNLFKWIHVPYNHAGWVPHVLTTCSREANNMGLHSQVLQDHLWVTQHNRSRHASPHARFVKPSVKCLLPKDQEHTDGRTTPTSAVDDVQYVIYLPYLHWDSFGLLKKRAKTIGDRRNASDVRPTDPQITKGKSMETKLIWQYLSADPPLHCRRTLDQYGYPTLRNTSARDADQVMYKRTKADKDAFRDQPARHHSHHSHAHGHRPALRQSVTKGKDDDAAKVLMVDQLWLWVLDGRTLVTFASPKERENDSGLSKQGDLLGNLYQNVNGDYADQCRDPFDFAALAVLHAVQALLDHTTDLNLQVFRIFEEYISILTEQQTSSFKDFRNTHTSRDPSESDTTVMPRYIDNTADLDALLELRDIEDELGTLEKLFEEQKTGITDMIEHYKDFQGKRDMGKLGAKLLDEAIRAVQGYCDQVASMRKSALTAQSAYRDLLDMKQKQANIVEAHLSREQADNSQEQSRSILVFTFFTIIFLPLSFFASVFGINAREWSNVPSNLSLRQIFTLMGSISIAVIAIALFVGFNKFTRKAVRRAWRHTAGPVHAWWCTTRGMTNGSDVDGRKPSEGLNLERLAAMEAAKDSQRVSTLSRTYSYMDRDEEAGPRGSSFAGVGFFGSS